VRSGQKEKGAFSIDMNNQDVIINALFFSFLPPHHLFIHAVWGFTEAINAMGCNP